MALKFCNLTYHHYTPDLHTVPFTSCMPTSTHNTCSPSFWVKGSPWNFPEPHRIFASFLSRDPIYHARSTTTPFSGLKMDLSGYCLPKPSPETPTPHGEARWVYSVCPEPQKHKTCTHMVQTFHSHLHCLLEVQRRLTACLLLTLAFKFPDSVCFSYSKRRAHLAVQLQNSPVECSPVPCPLQSPQPQHQSYPCLFDAPCSGHLAMSPTPMSSQSRARKVLVANVALFLFLVASPVPPMNQLHFPVSSATRGYLLCVCVFWLLCPMVHEQISCSS